MSYFSAIRFEDSGSLDAFSRLRVSQPDLVFDCQLTYNLQPLLLEPIVSGSGAAISHDATNRMAILTFASTPTGNSSILQTFEHFRYQPGRSQIVFATFNFLSAVANTTKFVGYSDGTNGIELRQTGSAISLNLLSATGSGNQTVAQASWNIDPMNGSGSSGITLDFTKTQILVIDFQALYVGRVRIGFDIDGILYYVHEYNNANSLSVPYIQSANLPVRCGMTSQGTVSTTMNFICCAVLPEGGAQSLFGYGFTQEGTVSASSGARTHLLSIRPKTTYNSIVNRTRFILDTSEFIVTGSNPVRWELCLGQAISGSTGFTDVDSTYSAFEFNTAGTISGSPTVVIASGYISASNQTKGTTSSIIQNRYPITLDAAGAVRSLGTLSLIVTGIGGASATRGSFNWREIR